MAELRKGYFGPYDWAIDFAEVNNIPDKVNFAHKFATETAIEIAFAYFTKEMKINQVPDA